MIKKKYLTFDELATRWGCDKKDIHYLISEGDLVPSIAWNHSAISCQWEPSPEDHSRSILAFVRNEQSGEIEAVSLRGWVYLRRPMVVGPYDYTFSHANYEFQPRYEEFSPGAMYKFVKNQFDLSTAYVDGKHIESNAVFMLDEIHACENFWHPSIAQAIGKQQSEEKQKNAAPPELGNETKSELFAGKPMATIERNTLLIIIAALCDYSAIDPAIRGAASQIANLTQEIGAPITDDTIRKVLAKIPDALEARMK